MTVQSLEPILAEHPFCEGLDPQDVRVLSGCASNLVFRPGEMICREGEHADRFYLIREGRIAIEVYTPERGQVMIQTAGAGEMVGWSWLVPPHRWRFDVRALDTTRALALDAECLRGKCEIDPRLGYELLKRTAAVFAERLLATRLQLLDVYGDNS
ncbi:MAG: cyclic nucleotide-binding domain-containing protein [Acidobacteria bacterium]|nr:cyclic nucleotide-binding domain-containing protein [Acidobacteriota bacterium]